MKRTSIVLLTLTLTFALYGAAQTKTPAKSPAKSATSTQKGAAAASSQAAPWEQIKKPPLPPFNPQEPKRVRLDNGMVVFLQEDHELPLIDGAAYIHGGSKDEPAVKVGLASIYGSAWRTGGTKTKTGDQLDDQLESRAARVETGGGAETTSIRFSCLKGDFDFVFDIFNDVLHNPEFRQPKIDLARDAMRTSISRRNDDIGEIAARESTKIGYGPQSPFAREPEYATVNAITRQDLLDWHAKYVHPNNIVFGIVGDFDSAAMEKKLRSAFDSWPKGPAFAGTEVAITDPKPGIYFVEKEDVNQSAIRMVALGIRRDNPDYFAVQVMNEIFGGGFASRLVRNLREKAGLAYDVGGGVGSSFSHRGLTRLEMGTKSQTTVQGIEGLYKQVDEMRNVPVTAAEMKQGKDAILNSFIFRFDTPEKVMLERMTYQIFGYPADFLERFRSGIEKTTAEDVDRVARKYLADRNQLAVLVVGKSADFDKPLSTLGQVTNIDITIPEAGATASSTGSNSNETGAANFTSNPEGKALLSKVIDAAGGAAKLKSVKSTHRKATVTLKAQGGAQLQSDQTDVIPDKVHLQVATPSGEITMVSSPEASFVQLPMGTQPMPPQQREDFLKGMQRSVWYIAQHADDPKYTFSSGGVEPVGDLHASVLNIRTDLQQLRWYVDAKSGRILRAQFQAPTPAGPVTRVSDYSDWKTIDGITVPFHEESTDNGEPSATVVINSLEFNPQVDSKLFQKPAPDEAAAKK